MDFISLDVIQLFFNMKTGAKFNLLIKLNSHFLVVKLVFPLLGLGCGNIMVMTNISCYFTNFFNSCTLHNSVNTASCIQVPPE